MAHFCRAKKIVNLHRGGMADCQAGKLDSAVLKLSLALAEVRKIGLACYQVKILNNLGIVFELMGNQQEARDHYQAALGAAGPKLTKETKLYQTVHNNLNRVSRPQPPGGNPEQTRPALRPV